jgi:septation ring formation regulator EzrA
MPQITNELIYEILKKLQTDVAELKTTLTDHTRQLLRIREDINSVREDINNLRRDDVRQETMQVQMDTRLERIERRLNLSDA